MSFTGTGKMKIATICPRCSGTKAWGASRCRGCWAKDRTGQKRPGLHSAEVKMKMSNDRKGKFGEESRRWKGGRLTYKKKLARLRDNSTCQVCGLFDKEIIQVDHIIPVKIRPELKNDLSNLICLCPNCHARKTVRDMRNGLGEGKLTSENYNNILLQVKK